MIVVAAFFFAPVVLAIISQGLAGLGFGWQGASWVALVAAIVFAALLLNHYSIPIWERNDRTGFGEVLTYGSWLALAESLVVFLTGRTKAAAQQKEEFE